jgi:hypothetical protein
MVDASVNKTSISVSSARVLTRGALIANFSVRVIKKLKMIPMRTITIGGVTTDFSASFENNPYIRINEAATTNIGYSAMTVRLYVNQIYDFPFI